MPPICRGLTRAEKDGSAFAWAACEALGDADGAAEGDAVGLAVALTLGRGVGDAFAAGEGELVAAKTAAPLSISVSKATGAAYFRISDLLDLWRRVIRPVSSTKRGSGRMSGR
jgi:hypothetical protein